VLRSTPTSATLPGFRGVCSGHKELQRAGQTFVRFLAWLRERIANNLFNYLIFIVFLKMA
jgi:hypothetical protein